MKKLRSNPEPLMIVSANPRGRKRRGGRRRSRGGGGGGFVRTFKPSVANMKPMLLGAAQGAAGALAVNFVLRAAAPVLPAQLMAGRVSYLTRAAVALGVGFAASHVNNRLGQRMAEGALIVVAVDAIRDLVRSTTGMELGGVSYFSPARVMVAPRNVSGVGKQLTSVSGTGRYLSGVSGNGSRGAVNSGYGMPGYSRPVR